MDEKLLSAVIAGGISLVISFLTYIATERRLKHERSSATRQIAQKFAEELLKHRLRLYPGAFVATSSLGKGNADDDGLPEKFKASLDELRKWKTGEVEVVISEDAENCYYELIERPKRSPGRQNLYNRDQLNGIYHARQKFRGALRRDLGLLKAASRLRLHLPEDDV